MNKMVATTLEAKFHVFDLRTHHPQNGFASLTEKVHTHKINLYRHMHYVMCKFYNSVDFDPIVLLRTKCIKVYSYQPSKTN